MLLICCRVAQNFYTWQYAASKDSSIVTWNHRHIASFDFLSPDIVSNYPIDIICGAKIIAPPLKSRSLSKTTKFTNLKIRLLKDSLFTNWMVHTLKTYRPISKSRYVAIWIHTPFLLFCFIFSNSSRILDSFVFLFFLGCQEKCIPFYRFYSDKSHSSCLTIISLFFLFTW